ncbi:MAG: hypothetical protein GY702_06840 [Desulfobulbaceae bacterium]|nr:hypothetical protein [Desulfobulbaceae bacterium]
MRLIRYWFSFDITLADSPPPGILAGCGVTASDHDEALELIRKSIFKNRPVPSIKKCIEDVDVSSLDKNHVLPNMANPAVKGIWYPLGYS